MRILIKLIKAFWFFHFCPLFSHPAPLRSSPSRTPRVIASSLDRSAVCHFRSRSRFACCCHCLAFSFPHHRAPSFPARHHQPHSTITRSGDVRARERIKPSEDVETDGFPGKGTGKKGRKPNKKNYLLFARTHSLSRSFLHALRLFFLFLSIFTHTRSLSLRFSLSLPLSLSFLNLTQVAHFTRIRECSLLAQTTLRARKEEEFGDLL